MKRGNREYKDALFKFIFGNEQHKEFTLSLYNAINNTNYTNKDDISFNTLDDILYIKMKNDVSFLFDYKMTLFEQQSTWNPNIPYRMFEYLSILYKKYISENKINVYSQNMIKLPAPKCVMLYNGDKNIPNVSDLRLSSLFLNNKTGDIELIVKVYNINEGSNSDTLTNCKPLKEYAWIVQNIKDLYKEMNLLEAINITIDKLPKDFLIRDLLLNEKSEVISMLTTEFDQAAYEKAHEEYAEQRFKDGLSEGAKNERKEIIKSLFNSGLSIEQITNYLNLDKNDVEIVLKNL